MSSVFLFFPFSIFKSFLFTLLVQFFLPPCIFSHPSLSLVVPFFTSFGLNMSMKEFFISVGPVKHAPYSFPSWWTKPLGSQFLRLQSKKSTLILLSPIVPAFDPSAYLTGGSSNMYPVSWPPPPLLPPNPGHHHVLPGWLQRSPNFCPLRLLLCISKSYVLTYIKSYHSSAQNTPLASRLFTTFSTKAPTMIWSYLPFKSQCQCCSSGFFLSHTHISLFFVCLILSCPSSDVISRGRPFWSHLYKLILYPLTL